MKIKRALLSVSDKTGIVDLGKFLSEKGVEIISTGGTMKALRDAGVPVTYVSDVTGFPEIIDFSRSFRYAFLANSVLEVELLDG